MSDPTARTPSDRHSSATPAASRRDRFLQTATEILSETGRTDFTVSELAERNRTSLRSFYQHFSSKDELLLALFEEVISVSVHRWGAEIAEADAAQALRTVIANIGARSHRTRQVSLNRALSSYQLHLAETHPREYQLALTPLHTLIHDLMVRGVAEGSIRDDVDPSSLSLIVLQTVVGSPRSNMRGPDGSLNAEYADALWNFCVHGLRGPVPANA